MMPRTTVIDTNENRILLWDGTAVKAIPYDPYHDLKYGHFDGNRIFHAFGGNPRVRIEETYNDGIFNAYRPAAAIAMPPRGGEDEGDGGGAGAVEDRNRNVGEEIVQISDAVGLAKAVMADDAAEYDKIFAHWYRMHMQVDVVDHMIASGNPERIRPVVIDGTENDGPTDPSSLGYIVDGRFMVDGRGAAYYRREDGEDGDGEDTEDDTEAEAVRIAGGQGNSDTTVVDGHGTTFRTGMAGWRYLCLVVDENGEDEDGEIIDVPGTGTVRITAVTRVVIAKIAFLLHPSNDAVFLNQLPDAMQKSVMRMIRDGGSAY